ncbi:TetR/AcrR family transcriptional regulator [Enterococcus sp. AZ109]|uniref:TetR/AcrR family transcriptional regulator n=1 Tax=Enterococcus sp. AZ109 TaxID=2774634 RepID=UPI003F247B0B
MVRSIRIQREHLIEGSYRLIIEQGFSKFNARNIAKQINCSTQPIYREFENMTNFKTVMVNRVIAKYKDFLEDQNPETVEQLTHLIIGYATDYPEEFHRFFLQDTETIELAKEVTSQVFSTLKQVDTAELYDVYWPYCLGKAVLAILVPKDHQTTDNFQQLLEK